jgi:hypothetical protein
MRRSHGTPRKHRASRHPRIKPGDRLFSQWEKGFPGELVSVGPLLDRFAGRFADPDLGPQQGESPESLGIVLRSVPHNQTQARN